MSVVRIAMTVASAAATAARNPVVRSALENPRTREVAVEATKKAAYNAGRFARFIAGPAKK